MRIIIIEDKPEEQQNALETIKRSLVPEGDEPIGGAIGRNEYLLTFVEAKIMVSIAPSLDVAYRTLFLAKEFSEKFKSIEKVCVLTDLMFPSCRGGKEEPNGLSVLAKCIQFDFPVVVCSDTDHHDVQYLKDVFPILGNAHPRGEIPVILDEKNWDRAVAEGLRMFE